MSRAVEASNARDHFVDRSSQVTGKHPSTNSTSTERTTAMSTNSKHLAVTLALVVLHVAGAATAAHAACNASLGSAANFTVLACDATATTFSSGNTRVNGNVGIGVGGSLDFS